MEWFRDRDFEIKGTGTMRFHDDLLYGTLGLIKLELHTLDFPWAKVCTFVREPDEGDPYVRFDERDVETESMDELLRHRQTKETVNR